ncbi:hypothetical protein RB195_000045 [Necator americanus]|uniref:Uncharacterized protein n=1 Tax=Necator americanus TaxID=51031 RepID=A0ABR1D8C2_NECAM
MRNRNFSRQHLCSCCPQDSIPSQPSKPSFLEKWLSIDTSTLLRHQSISLVISIGEVSIACDSLYRHFSLSFLGSSNSLKFSTLSGLRIHVLFSLFVL